MQCNRFIHYQLLLCKKKKIKNKKAIVNKILSEYENNLL